MTLERINTPNIKVTEDQWVNALKHAHNKVNSDGTTEYFNFATNEEKIEGLKKYVLSKRNKLLIESDCALLPDSPLDKVSKQKWKDYRQALRDITSQESFLDVTWPVKP